MKLQYFLRSTFTTKNNKFFDQIFNAVPRCFLFFLFFFFSWCHPTTAFVTFRFGGNNDNNNNNNNQMAATEQMVEYEMAKASSSTIMMEEKGQKELKEESSFAFPSHIITNSIPNRLPFRVFPEGTMQVQLAIGTPGQIYNLDLDFGYEHSILLGQQVPYKPIFPEDPPSYVRHIYYPNASETAVDLGLNYTNSYDHGTGIFFSDIFNGHPKSEQKTAAAAGGQRFGFVLLQKIGWATADIFGAMPVDGRIGLAPSWRLDEGPLSFLATMAQVDGGKVSPTITVAFHPFNPWDVNAEMHLSNGTVAFHGDRLVEWCNASDWSNWLHITHGNLLHFKLDTVWLGTDLFAQNEKSVLFVEIFYIFVPSALMSKFAKLIGATPYIWNTYSIPCNATETAPTITLFFDNYEAKFHPNDYIFKMDDYDDCGIIFAKGYYTWDLGYSFFNQNCLAMDVGELEQKVSFAHVVR